jgi:hypothetical protein
MTAAYDDVRRFLAREPESADELDFMLREAEGAKRSRLCA